jgi:hypothetical protein
LRLSSPWRVEHDRHDGQRVEIGGNSPQAVGV